MFNNGSEFKLYFLRLLDTSGVTKKPTTVKNPQANGILERVHQTLGNMLRTAELDMADSVEPEHVDDFLDNATWAIRSTHHTVLKSSPGAAIFGRGMVFNIPIIVDWTKIRIFDKHKPDVIQFARMPNELISIIKLGDEF